MYVYDGTCLLCECNHVMRLIIFRRVFFLKRFMVIYNNAPMNNQILFYEISYYVCNLYIETPVPIQSSILNNKSKQNRLL